MLISISFNEGIGDSPKIYGKNNSSGKLMLQYDEPQGGPEGGEEPSLLKNINSDSHNPLWEFARWMPNFLTVGSPEAVHNSGPPECYMVVQFSNNSKNDKNTCWCCFISCIMATIMHSV